MESDEKGTDLRYDMVVKARTLINYFISAGLGNRTEMFFVEDRRR